MSTPPGTGGTQEPRTPDKLVICLLPSGQQVICGANECIAAGGIIQGDAPPGSTPTTPDKIKK